VNDAADTNTDTASKAPAWKRYLPLAVLAAAFIAFFAAGGGKYINLEALAENRTALADWTAVNPLKASAAYFLVYIVSTAASLPIGTMLTLAGGFVFGTFIGGSMTVISATIGATILFLAARNAFADFFRDKVGEALNKMRKGFEENAFSYILALRLAPVFPFFMVNVTPALAGASLKTFIVATALGIIPGTFVYASVGAGLGAVFAKGGTPNLHVIFEWEVILPLVLLALLSLAPILYKKFTGKRLDKAAKQ
jgi:uncharacterized membrane protein YdjX (TVP38/TMEM64 family)